MQAVCQLRIHVYFSTINAYTSTFSDGPQGRLTVAPPARHSFGGEGGGEEGS